MLKESLLLDGNIDDILCEEEKDTTTKQGIDKKGVLVKKKKLRQGFI